MERVIKKTNLIKLSEWPLISRLLGNRHEKPAPGSQWEIDRLTKGWERESESTRARMARIGI